jgi:hypothetical protein
MKSALRDDLKCELEGRGFRPDGSSPNSTVVLDDAYLDDVDIAELLEIMVARREKIFQSPPVVGLEAAKASYADVVLVIEALKTVIGRLA